MSNLQTLFNTKSARSPHLSVAVADLSALQPLPTPCGCNPLPQAGEVAIESLRELQVDA